MDILPIDNLGVSVASTIFLITRKPQSTNAKIPVSLSVIVVVNLHFDA